uniref:Uncharacterized protein n=1 Tax=Rhizobium meliloti TaxID=382 RepID=I2E1W8_RHIML|nr:short hypothetical protein [Sinorhizobium meliloti]
MAGFKSEWWPVFDWNGGRLHVGIRIRHVFAKSNPKLQNQTMRQ